MIQRKTRQDFKYAENLGQRIIKDIEDKREAKVSSLEDRHSVVQLREIEEEKRVMGCPDQS